MNLIIRGGNDVYIYYVRHGETNLNKEKRVQGISNYSINENGIRQAEEAMYLFENKQFDVMVVSPLKRTLETGLIITSKSIVKTLRTDKRIIEKDFGITEGMLAMDRKKKYPNGHAPGEESFQIIRKRMKEAIVDYANTYSQDVLIVGHGTVLAALIKELDPSKEDEYLLARNLSMTVINGDTLKVEAYDLIGEEAKKWMDTH